MNIWTYISKLIFQEKKNLILKNKISKARVSSGKAKTQHKVTMREVSP